MSKKNTKMEDKIFNFLINYFSNINDRGVDEMNNFRGDITSDEIVEWLKNIQTSSEQPSEDLEEAADCYLDTISLVGFMEGDYDGTQILDAFRTGAQWQKEQMMKSAIEGCYIKRNRYTKENVLNGLSVTCDTIQKFKDGDKVKVIVIKEDEQCSTE
jgi:hypothetical protein